MALSSSPTSYQILIVDDAQLMCHFVYDNVMAMGNYECRTAREFTGAETILQNEAVNMAIIDIHLEDYSGITLAKRIRQGKYRCPHDIPILIFSGNTHKKAIKECMLLDVQDIIVKPVTAMQLRQRIKKNHDKKRNVKPKDAYIALMEECNEAEVAHGRRKPTVRITKQTDESASRYRPQSKVTAENQQQHKALINWPDDLGSGYHQIDRRLNSLMFQFNSLHWAFCNRPVFYADPKDIKEIRLNVDDLRHVTHRLRVKYPDNNMWPELMDKLAAMDKWPLENLCDQELSNTLAEETFHRIRTLWLSVLSKPVMKRIQQKD